MEIPWLLYVTIECNEDFSKWLRSNRNALDRADIYIECTGWEDGEWDDYIELSMEALSGPYTDVPPDTVDSLDYLLQRMRVNLDETQRRELLSSVETVSWELSGPEDLDLF